MHDEIQLPNHRQTEPAASSRRRLLGASAGAFALAASGLFLPPGLVEEAAAREGANHGKLGGRHGKNRRGKDRKKGRSEKQSRASAGNKAPGGGLIKSVGCDVSCQDGTWSQLRVDFYYRIKGSGDTWSGFKFGGSDSLYGVGAIARYKPDRYSIAAYIHADNLERACFVEMLNPLIGYPYMKISLGGSIDGNGAYVHGAYAADESFGVGDRKTLTIGNATFPWGTHPVDISVYRAEDTNSHKWFKLYVITG
ncbi:MAG: hypothetical protein QM692_10405 [Thermomicrobiales bacterium]